MRGVEQRCLLVPFRRVSENPNFPYRQQAHDEGNLQVVARVGQVEKRLRTHHDGFCLELDQAVG
jgi:hypothetical protein